MEQAGLRRREEQVGLRLLVPPVIGVFQSHGLEGGAQGHDNQFFRGLPVLKGGLLHVEPLGLGHAEQLLYQPPGLVPADACQRLFRRAYVVRGEQAPFHGGAVGRRTSRDFRGLYATGVQGDVVPFFLAGLARRKEAHLGETQFHAGRPPLAPVAGGDFQLESEARRHGGHERGKADAAIGHAVIMRTHEEMTPAAHCGGQRGGDVALPVADDGGGDISRQARGAGGGQGPAAGLLLGQRQAVAHGGTADAGLPGAAPHFHTQEPQRGEAFRVNRHVRMGENAEIQKLLAARTEIRVAQRKPVADMAVVIFRRVLDAQHMPYPRAAPHTIRRDCLYQVFHVITPVVDRPVGAGTFRRRPVAAKDDRAARFHHVVKKQGQATPYPHVTPYTGKYFCRTYTKITLFL